MEIITILNRKGGSTKTTTSIALADYLVTKNKNVLIIDLDSQANTTDNYLQKQLSVENKTKDNLKTLYNVIVDKIDINETIISISNDIYNIDGNIIGNLDIIPSNTYVGELLKSQLKVNPEKQLLKQILNIKKDYDFIIIDTIPAEDVILYNSILPADKIIVPIQLEEYSISGLKKVKSIIDLLSDEYSELKPQISNIILTNVDLVGSTKTNKKYLSDLIDYCKENQLNLNEHVVRHHQFIKESRMNNNSIFINKQYETKYYGDSYIKIDFDNKDIVIKNQDEKKIVTDYPSVTIDYINIFKEILGE